METILRERLRTERRSLLKPYFDLLRSIGKPDDVQALADYLHLPNLQKVDDEAVVARQLEEVRSYLLRVKRAVQKFEAEKGLTI